MKDQYFMRPFAEGEKFIIFYITKVVITWSRLPGMKFCLVSSGSRPRYKVFKDYILRLHVKSFIPARRDFSFVLPGSCFPGAKFCHGIASAHLSRMKKLINTSVWKNPFKYTTIDRRYFYYMLTTHMTSICKKKVNKYIYRISLFYESIDFHKLTCLQRKMKRKCIQI